MISVLNGAHPQVQHHEREQNVPGQLSRIREQLFCMAASVAAQNAILNQRRPIRECFDEHVAPFVVQPMVDRNVETVLRAADDIGR
jgi:hypothetical protein